MGHLLGYARVSTTDQQPQRQVDALTSAGCYRVLTETASGARTDRPVLEQLLDQLRPGDTLVVWKLDRLGRSLRHLVEVVTGLADRGVGFRSLQEAIDTTTPGGKLVFHVFAALAEFERDLIRERISAGLAAARAQALIARQRWDLAERELNAALGADPHDPMALGLLALCLAKRRQLKDARRAAEEALRLAPDWAFTHHVMASVLFELEEGRKAEAAAREAIRLDPSNPDHQAMLAQVHLQKRAWRKALAAAERGLALDADHLDSAKLRAAALLQLGRRAEAGQVVGATLARDPSDATTHAGQGWTKLHAGDHRAALVDFREALRLDPTLDSARDGLLRALKAGNPVYRLLLRYLLWGSRLGPRAHWVVFGGAFIWVNGLRNWIRYNPDTRTVLIPITLVYLLFVLSVFIGEPLSTVLLSTSRYGRLLVRPEERTASAVLVGVLLTASVPLVAGLIMANDPVFFGGVAVLALIFPTMATVTAAPGRGRVLLGVATAVLSLLTVAAFTLALTGGTGAAYWLFGVVGLSGVLVGVTTFGSVLNATRTTR